MGLRPLRRYNLSVEANLQGLVIVLKGAVEEGGRWKNGSDIKFRHYKLSTVNISMLLILPVQLVND